MLTTAKQTSLMTTTIAIMAAQAIPQTTTVTIVITPRPAPQVMEITFLILKKGSEAMNRVG